MKSEDTKTLESAVQQIISVLTPDQYHSDEILKETPHRVAQALLELTSGYHDDPDRIINDAYYPSDSSEILLMRNIKYSSMCEHHLLPFFGEIHIAYIPNGKIIGLSKLPRLVQMYAHRLQLQERLVTQVAQLLNDRLQPKGLAVIATGVHLCASVRGIRDCSASYVATAFLGDFQGIVLQNRLYGLMAALLGSPASLANQFLKSDE